MNLNEKYLLSEKDTKLITSQIQAEFKFPITKELLQQAIVFDLGFIHGREMNINKSFEHGFSDPELLPTSQREGLINAIRILTQAN